MTILFEADWEHYPDAIIDLETKNTSFIRLAALYREMGIRNNSIILSLMDTTLIGVDPFDPNITPEMALRVAIESKNNFWYFIREIARDPSGTNEHPLLFQANRGLIATYFLFLNHITTYLIMIRQTGKSFGLSWLIDWLLNVRLTKAEISQLSKDEKLRGRELERLKAMELTLPTYMKQRGRFDPGNTEVLKVSALENFFKSYLPNKSPKLADMIGRGMTSQIVFGDELAYQHNNFITIPVMLSATLAAREVAKLRGEPYGIVFATTSGKRDTPEGKYAYKMVSEAAIWTEKMFDMAGPEALENYIVKNSSSQSLHVNVTLNHRQLGKDDNWLRQRLKDSMQEDPIQIQADFLNEWPSGTTTTPFSQAIAKAMRDSEVLDNFIEIGSPEPYALRWYYPEREIMRRMQDPHVLGIDPSEMVGRDSITLLLLNVITGEVAMAADISEGNLIHFSQFLSEFLQKHLKVTLIVERKNTGCTIIDYLNIYLPLAGINPFTRIYNQVVQFADDYPDRFRELNHFHSQQDKLLRQYKALFGWSTSGSGTTSRTDLYSRTLNSAAKMTGGLMRDRTLILQTLGLEIRNGRVDHAEGEHDDLTIAWLLSYWLLSLGRNLRYYGIEPSSILSGNPVYQADLIKLSAYDQMQANEARNRVSLLTEELKNEPDEYVARRLEYDLELAVSKLCEQDRKMVSADDLITKLREERSRNSRGSFRGYEYQ